MTETTKTLAVGTTILGSLLGSTLSISFGIYAIILYSVLAPINTLDTSNCFSSTALKLLLAYGILQLSIILARICGIAALIVEAVFACFGENELYSKVLKLGENLLNTIIGLPILGLMIAMSVLVWGDQCSTVCNDSNSGHFFVYMQTFLIINWIIPFGFGVIICCLSCLCICGFGCVSSIMSANF